LLTQGALYAIKVNETDKLRELGFTDIVMDKPLARAEAIWAQPTGFITLPWKLTPVWLWVEGDVQGPTGPT
jgi:hypothetical protein